MLSREGRQYVEIAPCLAMWLGVASMAALIVQEVQDYGGRHANDNRVMIRLMTVRERLQQEIEIIPEELAGEVLDFLEFIKSKQAHQLAETALLSESALGKDWLLPVEDEQWKDL